MTRLAAPGIAVDIDPTDGGRVVRLELDGVDTIGRADPEAGDNPSFYYGAFPMAPFAGRVAGGSVMVDGTSTPLPPTHRDGHVDHGLVHDVSWQVVSRTGDHLELQTVLDHRWPVDGTVHLTYDVAPGTLHCELRLRVQRACPASLGMHPWFAGRIEEHDAEVSITPRGWLIPRPDGSYARTAHLEPPRDAVCIGVVDPPEIRWGDRLKVRLNSAHASVWVVCEIFEGAVCVEPLTAAPSALTTVTTVPTRPLVLDWSVTAGF